MAAVLACGPAAVLSHRSAAALWGLTRPPALIEVTTGRTGGRHRGLRVHRSRVIDRRDRARIDGLPITSLARTLVDLAESLTDRQLADAIHEAEVKRLFDLRELEQALGRVPGRPGRHRLLRVLAAYGPPTFTRSEAERRFLELCSRHGLPAPRTAVGLAGYEVDFFWPQARLAVEVDGAAAHQTRRAFHADRRRDRALAAIGVQTLRVTWPDLEQPAGLAKELGEILRLHAHGPRR